jgi:hypothetical protein
MSIIEFLCSEKVLKEQLKHLENQRHVQKLLCSDQLVGVPFKLFVTHFRSSQSSVLALCGETDQTFMFSSPRSDQKKQQQQFHMPKTHLNYNSDGDFEGVCVVAKP